MRKGKQISKKLVEKGLKNTYEDLELNESWEHLKNKQLLEHVKQKSAEQCKEVQL